VPKRVIVPVVELSGKSPVTTRDSRAIAVSIVADSIVLTHLVYHEKYSGWFIRV
jgi:hypothetical protein